MKRDVSRTTVASLAGYDTILSGLVDLLESARRISARTVNAIMTATYWEVGRRIVEFEQGGKKRAGYGEALLKRLAADLTARFGRGFSRQNLHKYRQFFLSYPDIRPTPSGESAARREPPTSTLFQTSSEGFPPQLSNVAARFPLPWSHYVRLLALRSEEEEIKDPFVLEFLDLKDEYSESDLEEALIGHLESFLIELGGDFAFVARQRRLRIGDEWYRADLLFFHRKLHCLVVIDLKLGRFTHADAGQLPCAGMSA